MGLYVLTRNSNIRLGPGTDHKIAEVLPSGAGVDVVGRVVDKEWMLVASEGSIRGYVHQNLLIKAPGTELELAGGPNRRACALPGVYPAHQHLQPERRVGRGGLL